MQGAYKTVATRFPFLKGITQFLPDSTYEADPRHQRLTIQGGRLAASELEMATKLVGTEEELNRTQEALERARTEIGKYQDMGTRLKTYEEMVTELLEDLNAQRSLLLQRDAMRSVGHETMQRDFGVALDPKGRIIEASRRALKYLGYTAGEEAKGADLYAALTENSKGLAEMIEQAVREGLETTTFCDLSFQSTTRGIKKVGDVRIRLYYGPDALVITPDQPHQTANDARVKTLAAVTIISERMHVREARKRMKRMKKASRTANSQPNKAEGTLTEEVPSPA